MKREKIVFVCVCVLNDEVLCEKLNGLLSTMAEIVTLNCQCKFVRNKTVLAILSLQLFLFHFQLAFIFYHDRRGDEMDNLSLFILCCKCTIYTRVLVYNSSFCIRLKQTYSAQIYHSERKNIYNSSSILECSFISFSIAHFHADYRVVAQQNVSQNQCSTYVIYVCVLHKKSTLF